MSEPEELDASLMASLVIAEIAAWNAIERALSASRVPLSYGRYLVLLTITGALGRARIQDVASSQRITVGAASRLVDRLCADGLVQRHPSPADRRVALLSVTDEGARRLRDARGVVEAETRRVFSPLDPDQRASLSAMLTKVTLTAEATR